MKWLSILSLFPASSVAFLAAAPSGKVTCSTRLNYFPETFNRAEQCATHYGFCSPKELDELVDELEAFQSSDGENQDRDDYYDTKRVYELLQKQSELKHMMTDYVNDHHKETFDMSEV